MSDTKRAGNARDGARIGDKAPFRNNWRGYRAKEAIRRVKRSPEVVPDWPDEKTTKRENNRIRRAADRVAVRRGIDEAAAERGSDEAEQTEERTPGNGGPAGPRLRSGNAPIHGRGTGGGTEPTTPAQ